MLAPSTLRNSTRGAPGLLLAALFLVVRLLASSMAMAAPVSSMTGPAAVAAAVLCHTGLDDEAPQGPAHDHACLVCPACHAVSHVGLPMPMPAALPIVVGGDIGRAAAPPASTGPPHRRRMAAHPTGPPTVSI